MASGLERRPRDGYRFARPILRADDAQKSHSSFDIARTGKSPTRCPALLAKIFPFPSDPNHFYIVRIPAHTQGAFRDRHERRVGMRWTRVALLTRALSCGRRSRVVLTPRRWRQVGGGNSTGEGGKKARSPGRARNKPLKPSRAGMPG